MTAPTLIYLPGVQGDWTMIGAFRQALGERICWVEMTYPRSLTWSLADYAREIEEALVEQGVHRGWLLGESFGSQVMWELVKRSPQRWQGLILAGGFVKYPSSTLLSAARFLCPRVSHRLLHRCLPAYILYAHLRHSDSPTLIAGARDFVARRTVADQQALLQRLRLIAENDPRPLASTCRIPLHHLYGGLDPIVPWSGVVRWLKQHCPSLRASRRIWMSDHTVLATAAEASAAQIRQWMA
ncbi:MAG: alpha/beta hydrolase [Verrucomicrobiales bacterium]|nr:alpha/beta hydrolase [Verrucomicrobiales bacterium]